MDVQGIPERFVGVTQVSFDRWGKYEYVGPCPVPLSALVTSSPVMCSLPGVSGSIGGWVLHLSRPAISLYSRRRRPSKNEKAPNASRPSEMRPMANAPYGWWTNAWSAWSILLACAGSDVTAASMR